MDQTQRIDPNKTQMTPGPGDDPMRTQAMGAMSDPNRTAAMGSLRGLTAEVVPGRTASMANGPAREQFLLEFHGAGEAMPGMGGGSRTALNLCLVIDRSGSMEGPPLEYVKQACCHVVDLLSPNDILSIVTFEEVVDVLMPPQRVTNKQPIKDGIQRLMAGNTTDLHGGIMLGAAQVAQVGEPGRSTRLVVFSDGDPTTGVKDFHALVSAAGDIKARGVTITFLGFGPDYNEELLASMAKKAGGNYYYIQSPELIPEVFRTELDKMMTAVARNLKLELKLARWVTLRGAHAQMGAPGDRELTIELADLERGAHLQQVIDLEFQNHPLGHYRVASGRLTYDDMVTGKNEVVDLDFVLEFTSDTARFSAPQDPRVRQAADVLLASRAVEKTIMGLKTQQLSPQAAVAELQKTQALLLQEGRTAEAQEVTQALRAIQSGDQGTAEKTLIGTMLHLDQGKHS
ncbi:MAG: VWA domain-containing protein [Fimbriimonadaceae bacterium]|nr:VWA domain-containing protein [Chthonomonadaceae bacterium]MCO5296760.1 VWA domain-containing protein [Fimbriimonadaceae bacterium]